MPDDINLPEPARTDFDYGGQTVHWYTADQVRAAVLADREGRQHDADRWAWATSSDNASNTLHSIVLCHGGYQQKVNERADAYREAEAQRAKEGA